MNKVFILTNSSLFIKQHLNFLLENNFKNTKIFLFTRIDSNFEIKSQFSNIIHIPIRRNPSIVDFVSILYYAYYRLKIRPKLSLSFTPKASIINSLTSYLPGNTVHYFTGQRWATFKGFKKNFYKSIDRLIIDLSNSCYSDSFSQSNFIAKELNTNPPKVIGNGSLSGVNLKTFSPNIKILNEIKDFDEKLIYKDFLEFISNGDKRSIFAFIGRICTDKGITECLKAFKRHLNLFPLSKLLFIGPLEINNHKRFNFPNKKQFMHINFTENVNYYLPHITGLILPSYREGFGSVVLEAAACKIPSIASDIPGPRDFIKHLDNGYLIKPYSINDIEIAMKYFSKNPKRVKEMGLNAYAKVLKSYSSKKVISNFNIEFGID